MKTMTCKQLGGPKTCDKEFRAKTFDGMAKLSKKHGMKMFQKKEEAHLEAMRQMKELMQKPEAMQEWIESKRKEFEKLPDN